MKKLLIFVSILMITLSLSACDMLGGEDPSTVVCQEGYTLNDEGTCVLDETEDPLVCPAGQVEEDGVCVDEEEAPVTCPVGQHEEDGNCVDNALECTPGYHEEDGTCVPDEGTDEYRDLVIDGIIAQMDITPVYLGVVMQDMSFDQGMQIMYELDLSVTEDVDEVHSVSATITDTMVDNMLQRELYVMVDEEVFEFAIYYETVETGVKVYMQPSLFIDALRESDPNAADRLEWVGFDNEWAVFEFDESLETMIQMDVLRDMMAALFFNEVGELFFYEVQDELEAELGIDLEAYGIDLGLYVNHVLAEEYEDADALINGIDVDGLMLHIDCLYIAPELYDFFNHYSEELIAEGFDVTKLELLNTAHYEWNEVTFEDELILDVELDGTSGTEAFLNSLTPEDETKLVETLKTVAETQLRWVLQNSLEIDYNAKYEMFNVVMNNQSEFVIQFGQARFDELAAMRSGMYHYNYDFEAYYESLTQDEIDWMYSLVYRYEYPQYHIEDMLGNFEDYYNREAELLNFLTMHQTELDAAGYDTQANIDMINNEGLDYWLDNMSDDILTPLLDEYLYTYIDELEAEFAAGTGVDFVFETIFGNSHTAIILGELEGNPLFDVDSLLANMVAIDWNVIGSEMIDHEALATAIYEGPDAYAQFLTDNETAAPNLVMYLEIFSPAVETAQPFMVYVDEMMYAVDGLEVFSDLIDPLYYTEVLGEMTASRTENSTLLLEYEIDGIGFATLFGDMTDNVNEYMLGFTMLDFPYDENWACVDVDDEFCNDVDFAPVLLELLELESVYLTVEMDPNNMNWMSATVDMTELLNAVTAEEYQNWLEDELDWDPEFEVSSEDNRTTGVINATAAISMVEVATLDVPAEEDTNSVNDMTTDFGAFLVSFEGYTILEEVFEIYAPGDDYMSLISLVNNPIYLSDIDGLYINGAFDAEMSFVTITMDVVMEVPNPASLDFELVLYWIDGEEVYAEGLGINELIPLFLEDDIVSEAAYDLLVSYPNPDTYALTRVWLMLAMEDGHDEGMYPEPY